MLGAHKKAVIQFSGGKDSLAVLYLYRDYLDKIEVIFADPGVLFPYIPEFVQRTCETLGAKLTVVKPGMDIGMYHDLAGIPSDIVPDFVSHGGMLSPVDQPKVLVQSTMTCCANMLWAPTLDATIKSGATLVLRGTKKSDPQLGVRKKVFSDDNGLTYLSPIWDWDDDMIMEYLKKEGAEIPPQYPEVQDGMDCWLCTGHLGREEAAPRMQYIVKHYPEYIPEIARRASTLLGVLHEEQAKVDSILNIAIEAANEP